MEIDNPARRRFRRPLLGRWAICCLLLIFGGIEADAQVPKEYELKAAFLYNFTKFVEWGDAKLGAPESPIYIGVLGINPFGDALESAVSNRNVKGRGIIVKRVSTLAAARSVHLLFVAESEDARLTEIREALKNTGVVTVGESAAFAKSGGVIHFAIEGDRVRFDINIAGADAAGVKISAQLQKLARTIRR